MIRLLLLALLPLACSSSPPEPAAPPAAEPAAAEPAAAEPAAADWTCSMHPDVHQDHPGSCPICGMDLVPAQVPDAHGSSAHMQHMAEVKAALQARLGEAYDAPVAHLEHADAAAGAETFAQLCTPCHGAEGRGDGPAGMALDPRPANLTDAEHARYYSDAGRMEIIRNGIPVPGSAMVGFGAQLDDAALLDLYAHVASLRGEEPAAHPHHDHTP